ncbi:MAG: sigma-70 family RNA polymerase sigma factor [Alphaproteobacteria bacterium]|nr:sigma-70 family RNA polymerase sigma factor [Alphaproteobacteria bacterium]
MDEHAAPAREADPRKALVALLPRLRRFARSLTGDGADADDVVQIAIERALRNIDQYERGTRLDSWMFRVLKNAWIDEVRARGRRAKVLAPAEAGETVGDDSAGAMEARLEMRAVENAMQTLPEEQRLAIGLVCVEGLSYKEAAEALDIPIGTLTSRLARGREALAAMLGGA